MVDRLKPEYISADEIYGTAPSGRSVDIDTAYGGQTPWQMRLQTAAQQAIKSRFRGSQRAMDLDSADPTARLLAESSASADLMGRMSPEEMTTAGESFDRDYEKTGIWKQAYGDFLQQRQKIGYALVNQFKQRYPRASEEDALNHAREEMIRTGFEPDDEKTQKSLPPLTTPPDELPSMAWAAIRGGVLGVGRGALRILNLPMQAHAITGEIVTDQLRQAESAISAEAPDKYIGWYEPLGARMSELENTNFYRKFTHVLLLN